MRFLHSPCFKRFLVSVAFLLTFFYVLLFLNFLKHFLYANFDDQGDNPRKNDNGSDCHSDDLKFNYHYARKESIEEYSVVEFQLLGHHHSLRHQFPRCKRHLVGSMSSRNQSYYLYRLNIFNDTLLLNLSKLNVAESILAPNFFLQYLDVNYTYAERYGHLTTFNPNNPFYFRQNLLDYEENKGTRAINDCIYNGQVLNGTTNQSIFTPAVQPRTIFNLCAGMYGVLELPQGVYFVEPLADSVEFDSAVKKGNRHLVYKHKPLTFHNWSAEGNEAVKLPFYSTLHKPNRESRGKPDRISSSRSTWLNQTSLYHHFSGTDPTSNKRDTGRKRPKRSVSREHHVEVLVVADSLLRRYHGANLENYIVTLLSIVASIYRHPTIEASINIVLVRLIILDHENAGPRITKDAHETLKYFCRWQQSLNDGDDEESQNHHDVAILLTRHDICRSPGKCDTLGLAELGTVCDSLRSCAIIEDNGLSAAFTIAHELGHLFNVPHDDEKECATFMTLEKYNYHIMAPTLEFNAHPWSWSQCSSKTLKVFLEGKNLEFVKYDKWTLFLRDVQPKCLYDKPLQQKYAHRFATNPNPGRMFSVDQQCQFVFGPSASLCPYMGTCKLLWCSTTAHHYSGCRTQHMPWADGTHCGHNKWCYHGTCVGVSPDQLIPEPGGWGEWQEWKTCSRSCGSGVQQSERFCDNPRPSNGGGYCLGERIRVRSCNVKECPLDTPEFREVQCSLLNNNRRGIQGVPENVKWVPQYTGISPNDRCKLYCAVESRSDFYLMKSKVVDGTPCDQESDDICVDGQCKQAGCDGYLKSKAKRDQCGICAGDGSKCEKIQGKFNEQTTYGYNFVYTFRAGLNNIDIRQNAWNGRKDDDTYLALQNSSGHFVLNGYFQVSVFHRQIRVQGAILEYSGSDSVLERINSSKPILEDLHLHVLSVGQLKPPEIVWEYLKLDDPQVVTRRNNYFWTHGEWSSCSSLCRGITKRTPICALTSDPSSFVDDRYCNGYRPPNVEEKVCNEDCLLKWISQFSSDCSVTCGLGERSQHSICYKVFPNGDKHQLPEENCPVSDKPPNRVQCFYDCNGRQWVYNEWSSCSATCGGGIQRRSKRCVDSLGSTLDDRYCENIISELLEQPCSEISCPSWVYDEWGKCSVSCGGGVQLRHVFCADVAGREVDYRLCNASVRLDRRKCNEQLCSRWSFGSWGQCSTTCGTGTSLRDANCIDTGGNVVDERHCVPEQKIVSKSCSTVRCPHWLLGEWSPCSKTCLDGWSSRQVTCVDSYEREIDSAYCKSGSESNDRTPPSHKPCNMGTCPFWRVQDWSECSVSCGTGQQKRIVECVNKEEPVDSSFCRDIVQPPRHQTCQLVNCPIWTHGPWDQCSVSCGSVGLQKRVVQCVYPDGNIVTERNACVAAKEPKCIKKCKRPCNEFTSHETQAYGYEEPQHSSRRTQNTNITSIEPELSFRRHDNEMSSPVKWETGAWTDCSATCDNGIRRRYVACRDVYNRILPDVYCSHATKPADHDQCTVQQCLGDWLAYEWQPCPATCGRNLKRVRDVKCVVAKDQIILPNFRCDVTKKPEHETECGAVDCVKSKPVVQNRNPLTSKWRAGEWGQCSKTCGRGWQHRLVTCAIYPTLRRFNTASIHCPLARKPPNVRPCHSQSSRCYTWSVSAWSQCDKTCGSGVQNRELQCLRLGDNKVVHSRYCPNTAPANIQACNKEPCRRKFVWKAGRWSVCSATCGRGKRSRFVHCVDLSDSNNEHEESLCGHLVKPMTVQRCRATAVCPRWHLGSWTPCSVTCGEGIKTRQVLCYFNHTKRVDGEGCNATLMPQQTTTCKEPKPCPSYRWRIGLWSKCSSVCGHGQQKREIVCLSNLGQKAPTDQCSAQRKPDSIRNCTARECPYFWVAEPWTTCSQSCGFGEQYRRFQCQLKATTAETRQHRKAGIKVPDYLCHGLAQAASKRSCSLGRCDSIHSWKSDIRWSQCSVTCGWGVQSRQVYCINQYGSKTDRGYCDQENKPKRKRRCFSRNCHASDCSEVRDLQHATIDGFYEIMVSGRTVKIYCHNMNESLPKEYLALKSLSGSDVRRNYAEFYSKRLLYPFTCPSNGNRNDSCTCTPEGSSKSGFTFFTKVRVDLKNMKINIMDSKFSHTQRGSFIPYATAGDCYSAVHCPQGRFNIDLTGTGFKVSPNTLWREEGHRTAMDVQIYNDGVIVEGNCGGYCGTCFPDKKSGLIVELDRSSFH